MKPKILYLSYNGMMEALGASQVLSYLFKLSSDFEYHLISLEKTKDWNNTAKKDALAQEIASHGIHWHPIEYKESKSGKIFNWFRFTKKTNNIIRKFKIQNLHCRSYFPALSAYLLQRKNANIKYLFDTRGFAFDERADTGASDRNGLIFKAFKKLEKKLYQHSAGINKLSYEGKRTILENELFKDGNLLKQPIYVIPTCVDLNRFEFTEREYGEIVKLGYVGTAIGWYDFDKTLQLVQEIGKKVDYQFTIFNEGQHDYIKGKLAEYNIPKDKVVLGNIPFKEMPKRLKEIEIALFYIHPFFSKRASAATKLGELLASGIPVISNGNVGDHEFYIEENNTGLILDFEKLSQYDLKNLINSIRNPETSQNCRAVAEKYFSADKGVEDYKKLYSEISFI